MYKCLDTLTLSKFLAVLNKTPETKLVAILTTIGNFKLHRHGGPVRDEAWDKIQPERDLVWGFLKDIKAPSFCFIKEVHGNQGVMAGCHECMRLVDLKTVKKEWQCGLLHLETSDCDFWVYVVHCSPTCANEFRRMSVSEQDGPIELVPEEMKQLQDEQQEETKSGSDEWHESIVQRGRNALEFVPFFDVCWRTQVSLADCAIARRFFEMYFGDVQFYLYNPDKSNFDQAKRNTLVQEIEKYRESHRQTIFMASCLFDLPPLRAHEDEWRR